MNTLTDEFHSVGRQPASGERKPVSLSLSLSLCFSAFVTDQSYRSLLLLSGSVRCQIAVIVLCTSPTLW
jgi:hypothetical protein